MIEELHRDNWRRVSRLALLAIATAGALYACDSSLLERSEGDRVISTLELRNQHLEGKIAEYEGIRQRLSEILTHTSQQEGKAARLDEALARVNVDLEASKLVAEEWKEQNEHLLEENKQLLIHQEEKVKELLDSKRVINQFETIRIPTLEKEIAKLQEEVAKGVGENEELVREIDIFKQEIVSLRLKPEELQKTYEEELARQRSAAAASFNEASILRSKLKQAEDKLNPPNGGMMFYSDSGKALLVYPGTRWIKVNGKTFTGTNWGTDKGSAWINGNDKVYTNTTYLPNLSYVNLDGVIYTKR